MYHYPWQFEALFEDHLSSLIHEEARRYVKKTKKPSFATSNVSKPAAADDKPVKTEEFVREQKKHTQPSQSTCCDCGLIWRNRHRCPAIGEICLKCGQKGHFARVCHSAYNKSTTVDDNNKNEKTKQGLGATSNGTSKSTKTPKNKCANGRNGGKSINKDISSDVNDKIPSNNQSNNVQKDTTANGIADGEKKGRESAKSKTNNNGVTKTVNKKQHQDVPTVKKQPSAEDTLQQREEANTLYKQKKYKQALAQYTRLIELCPESESNYGNRAACYIMMKLYDDALVDAKKSVELNPKFVKGYTRIARCAIALGKLEVAENALTTLATIEPNNESIVSERKIISVVQQNLKKFEETKAAKNFTAALTHLNGCLKISTHCISLKMKKSELLVSLELYKEAEEVALDVLTHDKFNIDAKYIAGLCIYHTDIDKAVPYLRDLLRLNPDDVKSLEIYKKAKILADMKKDGNSAFKNKSYAKAHELYLKALNIDPSNKGIAMKLYYNLSMASYKLGDVRRSIQECDKALAIDGNYVKALVQRGQCYKEMKEYENAVNDLTRACKLEPNTERQKLLTEVKKLLQVAKSDYHGILGVKKNASTDEMKKAYREKAMIHHPDRHSNSTSAEKAHHEKKFKEITQAYRLLSSGQGNNTRRRYYPNESDDNSSDWEDDDSDADYNPWTDDGVPWDVFAAFFAFRFAEQFPRSRPNTRYNRCNGKH